ncbi:MAG: iron-containing alcohol dehydrogenase [Mycoplasma sp.]
MLFTLFNQFFFYFLRNNIIVFKFVLFFFMSFNWGRKILYIASKFSFVRFFIPFFKIFYFSRHGYYFPEKHFHGEDSCFEAIKFIVKENKNLNVYWIEQSNSLLDTKHYQKLLEKNKVNFYLNNLKMPFISQKNIDQWEIEAGIFNISSLFVFGDDFVQSQSRSFNTQYGSKKPYVYYELWNLIKNKLPSHFAFNLGVSDGNLFSKQSVIFHKNKITVLSDSKLIPKYSVLDPSLLTNNEIVNKQKVCSLLVNAIECYLSFKNPNPFVKTQIIGSIEVLLKNLKQKELNLYEINTCSLMIGNAITHTNLGWIDIISYSVFSLTKTPTHEVKPTLFLHFLRTIINQKNQTEIYYYLQYLLDEVFEKEKTTVEDFYSQILKIFKSCDISDIIVNNSSINFNQRMARRIIKDSFRYFPSLFSQNYHDVKKADIRSIIYSSFKKNLYK